METTGGSVVARRAAKGANHEAAIWPADSLIVIVLTNRTDSDAERLDRAIARSILSVPEKQVLDLPLSVGALGRYVGPYETYDGRINVIARGSSLFALGERCHYQEMMSSWCGSDGNNTLRFIGDGPKATEVWVLVNGVRALAGVRKTPQ